MNNRAEQQRQSTDS